MFRALTEPFFKKNFWRFVLLITIPLLLFGKVQSFEFVNWDDDRYVYENTTIRSFSAENWKTWLTQPYVSLYVPVPLLTYAVDYSFAGQDPAGYHRTSLLFHLLNTLLVFLLLRRFFGNSVTTWLAGLLFSVHPVQAETVAWISERKTLLFSFFALAGLLTLTNRSAEPSGKTLFQTALLWLLAFLSKATAVVLPLLSASYDFFYSRPISRAKTIFHALLTAAAVLCFFTTILLYPQILHLFTGADQSAVAPPFSNFFVYLRHYLFPVKLAPMYDLLTGWQKTASVVGTAFLFLLWIRAIQGRKIWGFWLSWFLLALLPAASFLPVPVGDRHLYFASIGLLGCLLCVSQALPKLSLGIFILGILYSVFATPLQLETWRNNDQLWNRVPLTDVKRSLIFIQKAESEIARGNFSAAEKLYHFAIEERFNELPAILSLANLYFKTGELQSAENLIKKIQKKNPKHKAIPILRSGLALAQNQYDDAIRYGLEAGSMLPKPPAVLDRYMGLAYLKKSNYAEALNHLQRALLNGDTSSDLRFHTAMALMGLQHWDDALNELTRLKQAQETPYGLYFQMGYASLKAGQIDKAKKAYEKSTLVNPMLSEAHDHLGLLAMSEKNWPAAEQHFLKALEIDPSSAIYQKHLKSLPQLKPEVKES